MLPLAHARRLTSHRSEIEPYKAVDSGLELLHFGILPPESFEAAGREEGGPWVHVGA